MCISDNYNEPDIPDYLLKEAQVVTVQLINKDFQSFSFHQFLEPLKSRSTLFFNVKVDLTYVNL